MKGSLAAPAAMAMAANSAAQDSKDGAPPAEKTETLPHGKIGDLKVSRLMLGGNLLTHFTHSRDLKYVYKLAEHYNTDEKILETLAIAEDNGVNTLSVHTVPRCLATLHKHRHERGGKMQWIICPTAPVEAGMEAYRKAVEELVNDGTDAIYLWGVHADRLVAQGKMDLLAEAIAIPKEFGVPSGLGGHDLNVVIQSEKHNIDPDFYIKTFHHHNYPTAPRPEEVEGPYKEFPGYWCADCEQTVEVMSKVEKPWIAFKVMAAGAIPPKDAFQYVFEHGADHILAGMFDFEVAEDAGIIREALLFADRKRPWRS